MSGRVVWNENWLPPEAIEAGLKRSAIVAQAQMKRNFGSEGGGVLRKAKQKARIVDSSGNAIKGARIEYIKVKGVARRGKGGKSKRRRVIVNRDGKKISGARVEWQDKTRLESLPEGAMGPQRRLGTGRNVYYPSPPGAFPGVRTGSLRRAVMWWFPRSAEGRKAPFVRIGVPAGLSGGAGGEIAEYAEALEDPDKDWKAMRRPWAMRTVKQVKQPMAKAFAQGMRRYLAGRPK